jgi:hydroxyacylglutathione hydrolase
MTDVVHVECIVEPNFGENAYVVWTAEGGPCWIIDPGLPPSAAEIREHMERHRLEPTAILLTHGHADHIAGVPEVLEAYPTLPVYMADAEASTLTNPHHNLSSAFGGALTLNVPERRDLPADGTLSLGATRWRIIDTSGHSPGGRSFYCEAAGLVLVGDALFQGSIGRTDFFHSDGAALVRNIRGGLFALPDETVVHSGHGPTTTVGRERRTNPFVGDAAAGA